MWPPTATEMLSDAPKKLGTQDLKNSQHSNGNDSGTYALFRACCGVRPKPLPNILPKLLLSSQIHPVHAKVTQ
jgi:hypothetical protein